MTVRFIAARRLVVLTLVASLFVALVPTQSASASTPGEIRNSLERRINNTRDNRDRRKLKVDLITQTWATDHSFWMSRHSFLHDSELELEAEIPITWQWYGENIGWRSTGGNVARALHRAFMKSDGHRRNILKRRATHMGIGVVKHDGVVWVTERFVDLTD